MATAAPVGWVKGIVKSVPSGDSLVIMGHGRLDNSLVPEKTITLAAIIAPKLGRRDGRDEPFAWPSREALREKCIGKEIKFRIDYTVPSIGREFGSVILQEGDENVAYFVVAQGWAKVRPQSGQGNEVSASYLQELEQRETKARDEGLGMWNTKPGAGEATIRDLPPSGVGDGSTFDGPAFLEENKSKPLEAIVEQVRDGTCLRVILLPSFQYTQVFVAGIQSPSMPSAARARHNADAQQSGAATTSNKATNGDAKPAEGQSGEGSSSPPAPLTTAQRLAAGNTAAAAASADVPPDPLAVLAKRFTELRVLNRRVRVVLEGVDKSGHLRGSIYYAKGDAATDLSLELVREGLARVVEWSANMLDEEPRRALKAAELAAKKERKTIWTNYVIPASNSTAIHDQNFNGKVIEVVSGDCVVVVDDAATIGTPQAERRVNLSSIRSPKVGNPKRDEKPAPYAREAKEFLRQRLIGQQVKVMMEYSRKVGMTDGPTPMPAGPGGDERMMNFGSVFLLSPSKSDAREVGVSVRTAEQPEGINVAEYVLLKGLGTVVRHRESEERSNFYDALLAAESKAQKAKKGIHSGTAPPPLHINDLSKEGSLKQATAMKNFLMNKRHAGIVDYVLSGHRFKVYLKKNTCAIAFSLSGVRCPSRGEAFSEEAISFMRLRLMQRDVEIEIDHMAPNGTFGGTLWESRNNIAIPLLEAGLARMQNMSPDRINEGHLLAQAEQLAKKERLKIWESFVEGKDDKAASATVSAKGKEDVLEVKVTEIIDGGKFYAQTVGDSRTAGIMNQLDAFRQKDKPLPPGSFTPKKGDLVLALYKVDDSWNRAMVVNVPKPPITGDSQFQIFYIDYGNEEMIPLSKLRPMEGSLAASPQGLAQLYSLQYIKVPEELDDDLGQEAASLLGSSIGGRTLLARVGEKDLSGGKVKGKGTGPRWIVTLVDPDTKETVNSLMVQAGLAKVEKKGRWDSPEKKAALEKLLEFQDEAKKDRRMIWEYGDADSDEEDLPARGRGRGGGRR